MARPSQRIDRALLASGRALFPRSGCAGLSVRAVSEHAGANPAMFHYHFGSKDEFLRTLLQQMYEEMYTELEGQAHAEGTPLDRLRASLLALARYARGQRQLMARVWTDAMAGEAVAVAFFRGNAPRHLGLLFALLEQAHAEGTLRRLPPLQRFAFVMGSVLMPIIFLSGLAEALDAPTLPSREVETQVMGDAAIAQRIEFALAALAAPAAARRSRTRTTRRAAGAAA